MVLKGLIVPSSTATPAGGLASAVAQRVANRPILCHVLEEMRRASVDVVAIAVCEQERDAVQACVARDGPEGPEISYLPYIHDASSQPDEVAESLEHALGAAADLVGESRCVLHLADGLLDQRLEPLIDVLDAGAVDALTLAYGATTGTGAVGLQARRLGRLVDAAPLGSQQNLAGVCLLGPGALRRALGTPWWSGGNFDLVAVAQQIVARGGKIRTERVDGWLRYSGEVTELLEMNRIALDAMPLRRAVSSGTDSRIEGLVEIHPTASVHASTIVGPTVVGPYALIQDSYIGPYTSIGADVHIVGVELERSIILPGALITHIGGRLAGSVVGSHARVFRDFSLPRAMRINVGDGSEVSLC